MASNSTATKTRKSRRLDVSRRSSAVTALPAELVTDILGYLSPTSLRKAAGVSRQFYACARDAGLCIPCRIGWGVPMRCHQQLARLTEVVPHALRKNLRLSLTFLWFSASVHDTRFDINGHDAAYPALDAVLPVISSALPLLVYLSITVSNIEKVIPVLSQPMPRLQELDISHTVHVQRGSPFVLPRDLFAGHAPRLRKLELTNIALHDAALVAFANIDSLDFTYYAAPPNVAFAHHFPKLTALALRSISDMVPELSRGFNLTGLTLHQFAFEADMFPALQLAVAMDTIPVLRYQDRYLSVPWLEPDAQNPTDFSLRIAGRLDGDSEISVAVVPAHRRWCRIYDGSEWLPEDALPLADKPGGSARLTYLRVDNALIHTFLTCGAACPALRAVQVDLYSFRGHPPTVWPPNSASRVFNGLFRPEHRATATFDGTESPYDVPCEALEELTLFAVSESVTVVAAEVAFLGRALGQLARAKRNRAILALVGVEFAKPAARTLVGLTFSAVKRYAFAGRG